jgi:UDP-GlcNAc:undecaprenyl-phosphate GlcNAc-1-phosphate transferase
VYLHNELIAVVSGLAVVSILIASKIFGHAEFLLLSSRVKAMGISLVSPSKRRNGELLAQNSVRLQSSTQWDQLWTALTELADRLKLYRVQLNISLPALHEEYHASWERSDAGRLGPLWRTEIPLVARDHTFGRLEISGERDGCPASVDVGRLAQLLHPLETRMLEIAEQNQSAVSPGSSQPVQTGSFDRLS